MNRVRAQIKSRKVFSDFLPTRCYKKGVSNEMNGYFLATNNLRLMNFSNVLKMYPSNIVKS